MSGQRTRLGSGKRARKLSGGANEAPRFKTARRLVIVLVRPLIPTAQLNRRSNETLLLRVVR